MLLKMAPLTCDRIQFYTYVYHRAVLAKIINQSNELEKWRFTKQIYRFFYVTHVIKILFQFDAFMHDYYIARPYSVWILKKEATF